MTPERNGQMKNPVTRNCRECGAEFVTFWQRQIVCLPCRPFRGTEAMRCDREAYTKGRPAALEEIVATRGKQKTTIFDIHGQPDLQWHVTYSVPFSLAASKNRRWSNNGEGVAKLSESVRRYSEMVAQVTKAALADCPIARNKLWLSFYVEKPSNMFDAINVVDTLCDAIKTVTGLDDRWFCIGKVDWCIKKRNQNIIIRIGQESVEDVLICSHCGEMKEPEHFGMNKALPLGRGRSCIECSRILERHRNAARKEARAKARAGIAA